MMLKSLSNAAMDAIISLHEHRPCRSCIVVIMPLGEATGHVSHEATSFAHRKARYTVLLLGSVLAEDFTESLYADAVAWANEGASALLPFAIGESPAACSIEHGEGGDGTAALERMRFGDHLPRLRELKSKWDPENIFWSNCNVKPL